MAFTHTWEQSPQYAGQAALLAGLGEYARQQQAVDEEQRQFDARQALAEQELAAQIDQQHFGRQFGYDQLGQRDYEFRGNLWNDQQNRDFELLRQGLGIEGARGNILLEGDIQRGINREQQQAQQALEAIQQRGLDARANDDVQQRYDAQKNQQMQAQWKAILDEAPNMSDQQWQQVQKQFQDYWQMQGVRPPVTFARPKPQDTPQDDPVIVAYEQANPGSPKMYKTPDGKFELLPAEKARIEREDAAAKQKLEEAKAAAAKAEAELVRKETQRTNANSKFLANVQKIRSAYSDATTGATNHTLIARDIEAAKRDFEAANGFPAPNVDAGKGGEQTQQPSEPQQLIANNPDGTQTFIKSKEELAKHMAAHPGARYVTLDGRVLTPAR